MTVTTHKKPHDIVTRTRFAIFYTHFVNEPLMTCQNFIPYLLTKTLDTSAFWIVLLTTLKPAISLLSFFFTSKLSMQGRSLKTYLLKTGLLACLPFYSLLFLDHPLVLILCSVNYFLFYRANNPAWIEILKLNLRPNIRQKLYSMGWVLSYIESMGLAVCVAYLLDHHSQLWKSLILLCVTLSLTTLLVQYYLPIFHKSSKEEPSSGTLKEVLHETFALLRRRPRFSLFQVGFMTAGFGVMLIQPAIPLFCNHTLGFSYLQFGLAISICKGLGIAFTSNSWAKWLSPESILKLSSYVSVGFAAFPLLILMSSYDQRFFYLAYFVYGIAYSGSHLIWNMSGPIFAEKESSSKYSSINVVMVGIRGMVAPVLGGVLCKFAGISETLVLSSFCCILGAIALQVLPARLRVQKHIDTDTSYEA